MRLARRHGGLPLAVYVTALLMVPLAAVAVFGVREIDRNNAQAATASRLEDMVEIKSTTASLRTPLQVERIAALGLARLGSLGIDPGPVVMMTGLDFDAVRDGYADRRAAGLVRLHDSLGSASLMSPGWLDSFAAAVEDLDRAVQDMGWEEPPSTETITEAFDRVDGMLDQVADALAADPTFVATSSPASGRAVADLGVAATVATTAADEMSMVADLAIGTGRHEPEELAASRLVHRAALEPITAVDRARGQRLIASYDAIPASLPTNDHDATVEFAEVVATGEVLLQRIDYLEEVAEFVFDEGEAALAVVAELSRQAESDTQRTLVTFGAVLLASLAFGLIVIRSFVKPLRQLRTQAEKIGQGDLSVEPLSLEGPTDVRDVTGAVNEMVSTLELVEAQMQTLAQVGPGDSADVVALPGRVGASMRESMERVTALTSRLRSSEARLAREARTDALTGLPNRFAVLEHLGRFVDDVATATEAEPESSDGTDATLGVMFLDVDGFKSVNDMHGHAVGDVVLREIAQRLRGTVRDVDVVARLGGDEFLVVIDGVSDPQALSVFGQRLIREIEQPYVIGDQLFAVSASVGATLVRPDDDAMAAIERADAAVYQAKRRGRRRVELFDQELQASIEHQAELELALRQAIQHDELRLHLQPLADLATGRAAGAEALVRWQRPGVGLVPPGDFVPIAERSGLIFDLERWVLQAACQRVAEWGLRGEGAGMRLAVNISGRHLIEGDLLDALDSAIESTGANPNLLEIELTESHLLDDVNRARALLSAVRDRGIRVAIDDFGTGYSSMTYLQKLPVDIVKIDQSFVATAASNDFDSTVIESVVTISKALSLEIVAEGIETREQLDYVTSVGCTYGQGYYLSYPVPFEEAESIMFGGPLFTVDAAPEGELRPASRPARSG